MDLGSKSGEEIYSPVGSMFSMHPLIDVIHLFIARPYSMSDPLEYGLVVDSFVQRDS